MYFHELIRACDENKLVRNFLSLCRESDIKQAEAQIKNFIKNLNLMTANREVSRIIKIEKIKTKHEIYDDVFFFDISDNEKYGLETNPWADTLGYSVDEKSVAEYGCENFAALVLYEMTYFGYDEKTIQDHVNSWFEDEE